MATSIDTSYPLETTFQAPNPLTSTDGHWSLKHSILHSKRIYKDNDPASSPEDNVPDNEEGNANNIGIYSWDDLQQEKKKNQHPLPSAPRNKIKNKPFQNKNYVWSGIGMKAMMAHTLNP